VLAVASDDGAVRCFNTAGGGERICEMPAGGTGGGAGHEDAVQAVLFDGRPSEAAPSEFMVTCGSDCAVKIWA
jgi:WD40 repeat protein